MYIELHVVKWLKPLYNSAHVKTEKRKDDEEKRKKKHKKKTMSRHPQRETKALNHTEHLPLSRPSLVGNWATLHSLARLGSARHRLV